MHISIVFVVGLLAAANASVVKKRTICKEDNCLRALLSPTRPVASFCSAFLSTSTHPLPTFVNPCSSSLPRISSACDCALGRTSDPQPTTAPITTLTCTAETTTVTVPGAGEITTVTVPTTVTLPGEAETVTLPAQTVTLPGTTVTVPAQPCPTPEETGIPKSVPPYTYLQCTNNGGAQRALQGPPSASNNQTPAACASTCAGFTYFGVTRGNECVCGNTLNSQSNNPNDNACNRPCTGNNKQFCGGNAHIQLYKR